MRMLLPLLFSLSLAVFACAFSVSPVVGVYINEHAAISETPENVSFGETPGAVTLFSPNITIQNDGNVPLNISLWSNETADEFIGGTNPDILFNLSNAEGGSCASVVPSGFFTTMPQPICPALDFYEASDSLRLQIELVVPSDAPSGSRNATIYVKGNTPSALMILEIPVSFTKVSSALATPENLSITLRPDFNVTLNWIQIAGASSYNIYMFSNCSNASETSLENLTANYTTSALSWSDLSSGEVRERCYRIASSTGTGAHGANITVGKYDLSLHNGWNIISPPLNLTNWSLGNGSEESGALPTQPAGVIYSVYRHNASTQEFEKLDKFPWGWWPAQGSDRFTSLEPYRGYFLNVNSPFGNATLTFVGSVPEKSRGLSIPLSSDLNLVGAYSMSVLPVGNESLLGNPFTTIPSSRVATVYGQNGAGDVFGKADWIEGYGWWQAAQSSNFTGIEPASGFWLVASQSCAWAPN